MKYLLKLFFNPSMSLNGGEYLFRFILYFFLNFVGFVLLFQESKLTYISLGVFLIVFSTYLLFKSIPKNTSALYGKIKLFKCKYLSISYVLNCPVNNIAIFIIYIYMENFIFLKILFFIILTHPCVII